MRTIIAMRTVADDRIWLPLVIAVSLTIASVEGFRWWLRWTWLAFLEVFRWWLWIWLLPPLHKLEGFRCLWRGLPLSRKLGRHSANEVFQFYVKDWSRNITFSHPRTIILASHNDNRVYARYLIKRNGNGLTSIENFKSCLFFHMLRKVFLLLIKGK